MLQRAAWLSFLWAYLVVACHDQGTQLVQTTPTKLAFTGQPTNASAGAVITPPVQVTVLDAKGNIDTVFSGTNVMVAIKDNPGGGALSGTRAVAAVNGVATFSDLTIDKAAAGYTLSAGAAGLFGATSTPFYVAGTATHLAFSVQPTNTTASQAITPAIQIAVQDSSGNTVPHFAGNIMLSIGTNPGSGTLSGTRTIAASSGVATFSDLSIDEGGNGYTLLATAAGLSAATSTAFNAVCLNNCWTVKASMPTVRGLFGVGTVNGVLYTVGGYTTIPLATVEAYDPNTNSWTTKAPMPTARSSPGVGVVNGVLYAVGGNVAGTAGTVEAYDPVTNTWTTKQPMPTPRYNFGVGVVNGTIYAVGGLETGPSGGLVATGAVEAYDPLSNTWTAKAPMPTPRSGLAVGVVNGLLYAVGGAGSGPAINVVEAYDPVANAWASKASLPTGRSELGVGVVNGILYAVGGATNTSIVNTAEAYDPTRNTWTTTAPMPTVRRFLGIGVLNGVLYAIGGQYNNGDLGTNEAYQP